jgi:hypothetical protein
MPLCSRCFLMSGLELICDVDCADATATLLNLNIIRQAIDGFG